MHRHTPRKKEKSGPSSALLALVHEWATRGDTVLAEDAAHTCSPQTRIASIAIGAIGVAGRTASSTGSQIATRLARIAVTYRGRKHSPAEASAAGACAAARALTSAPGSAAASAAPAAAAAA